MNINAALSYELFRQTSKQTSAEGTAVDTDSTKERTVFKTVSEAALIYLLISRKKLLSIQIPIWNAMFSRHAWRPLQFIFQFAESTGREPKPLLTIAHLSRMASHLVNLLSIKSSHPQKPEVSDEQLTDMTLYIAEGERLELSRRSLTDLTV